MPHSPCGWTGVCDCAGHVCGLPASCTPHILTPATHWPAHHTICYKEKLYRIYNKPQPKMLDRIYHILRFLAATIYKWLRATKNGKQCNIHCVILRVSICKKLQLAQKSFQVTGERFNEDVVFVQSLHKNICHWAAWASQGKIYHSHFLFIAQPFSFPLFQFTVSQRRPSSKLIQILETKPFEPDLSR